MNLEHMKFGKHGQVWCCRFPKKGTFQRKHKMKNVNNMLSVEPKVNALEQSWADLWNLLCVFARTPRSTARSGSRGGAINYCIPKAIHWTKLQIWVQIDIYKYYKLDSNTSQQTCTKIRQKATTSDVSCPSPSVPLLSPLCPCLHAWRQADRQANHCSETFHTPSGMAAPCPNVLPSIWPTLLKKKSASAVIKNIKNKGCWFVGRGHLQIPYDWWGGIHLPLALMACTSGAPGATSWWRSMSQLHTGGPFHRPRRKMHHSSMN